MEYWNTVFFITPILQYSILQTGYNIDFNILGMTMVHGKTLKGFTHHGTLFLSKIT